MRAKTFLDTIGIDACGRLRMTSMRLPTLAAIGGGGILIDVEPAVAEDDVETDAADDGSTAIDGELLAAFDAAMTTIEEQSRAAGICTVPDDDDTGLDDDERLALEDAMRARGGLPILIHGPIDDIAPAQLAALRQVQAEQDAVWEAASAAILDWLAARHGHDAPSDRGALEAGLAAPSLHLGGGTDDEAGQLILTMDCEWEAEEGLAVVLDGTAVVTVGTQQLLERFAEDVADDADDDQALSVMLNAAGGKLHVPPVDIDALPPAGVERYLIAAHRIELAQALSAWQLCQACLAGHDAVAAACEQELQACEASAVALADDDLLHGLIAAVRAHLRVAGLAVSAPVVPVPEGQGSERDVEQTIAAHHIGERLDLVQMVGLMVTADEDARHAARFAWNVAAPNIAQITGDPDPASPLGPLAQALKEAGARAAADPLLVSWTSPATAG